MASPDDTHHRQPRLSDADYRLLVEQAPMVIWRADTAGLCDYFNDRWLAFTGRTMEQEAGNGWAEGVHPDDLERCLAIYQGAFARREAFEMEYRLRRHDGAYRWLFDRGTPCFEDGAFRGYIGSCVDVTERVEAERALRRKNEDEMERLRTLVPVCFGCKNVRSDKGYWLAVDEYFRESSGQGVTHGLCPTCLDALYPDPAPRPDDPRAVGALARPT